MLSNSLASRRKVKIVCTLGPSSQSVPQIESLIRAGMDVARLNFSHGSHDFHRSLIQNIRKAADKVGRTVGILQDLQGPKLRAGTLIGGAMEITEGQRLLLHPEGDEPNSILYSKLKKEKVDLLPISKEIALSISHDVRVGSLILFDDGKLRTRVLEVSPPEILVEVEIGGRLTNHKGMNLPGTPLSLSCLTDKDIEDLRFGLSQDVDAIALSFVRSPDDIEDLRKKIRAQSNLTPLLVSKIERQEAIEQQDSIIAVSDSLLVARGDMAVEIGAHRVPTVQKNLIWACNEMGVPVITATQMLESMIQSPTPTRAEASDVANAVFDGTDAVMLSGETASGKYPTITVETMARIVEESERSPELFTTPKDIIPMPGSVVESIEFSASRIAAHLGAVSIACITRSGVAARALAKYRPQTPIFAITEESRVLRQLAFVWGVQGAAITEMVHTDQLFESIEKILYKHKIAIPEDVIVVTAGVPTLSRGTTNMIKVHKVSSQVLQSD